ncbi:MAG TPA: DUF5009 domain-containing protein [Verrucomicrobiota bacterium]|nr:hypothetical protein [Verrucomicrobiales bacterium]HRI13187.1 DUF5009 domain-containing protein [Verrucomicrobiota bacterium]
MNPEMELAKAAIASAPLRVCSDLVLVDTGVSPRPPKRKRKGNGVRGFLGIELSRKLVWPTRAATDTVRAMSAFDAAESAKGLAPADSSGPTPKPVRIRSIDALRGLVMFTMIFVNDLAGADARIVPWWMRHFKSDGNGMTFVDLVFPAFLFIVGMSIPFGLGSRLRQGDSLASIVGHVLVRTVSLLAIGILMVNEAPNAAAMGWSPALWSVLMYSSAILVFSSFSPPGGTTSDGIRRVLPTLVRVIGVASLIGLAFAFRGEGGRRIITLVPFSLYTSWYGILGLIGWAYLVAATVFLAFREDRAALLGCTVLLLCLYVADRTGLLDGFWLSHYVGIGSTLGSLASIAVAGVLLALVLVTPETTTFGSRARFTLWFIAGFGAAAWLLHGLYGINKNSATPSWCLWACAITATLWLGFHLFCDVCPVGWVAKPLVLAGSNVLLAYLLSEMLPSLITLLGFAGAYDRMAGPALVNAVVRSAGCALVVLIVAGLINRAGLRLRL